MKEEKANEPNLGGIPALGKPVKESMKEVSLVRHQVNGYCTVTEARPSKKLRVGCGPHEAL